MSTSTDNALRWVMEHIPASASQALHKFTAINQHWRGANWDDALAVLMDSDSHLEITEPIMERLIPELPEVAPSLMCAVAITLLYASKPFATEYTDEERAEEVKFVIEAHGGVS